VLAVWNFSGKSATPLPIAAQVPDAPVSTFGALVARKKERKEKRQKERVKEKQTYTHTKKETKKEGRPIKFWEISSISRSCRHPL